jgi:hypothetical protein
VTRFLAQDSALPLRLSSAEVRIVSREMLVLHGFYETRDSKPGFLIYTFENRITFPDGA